MEEANFRGFPHSSMISRCSAEIEILIIADLEDTTRFGVIGLSNYMSI
jgi:hypothetical protein